MIFSIAISKYFSFNFTYIKIFLPQNFLACVFFCKKDSKYFSKNWLILTFHSILKSKINLSEVRLKWRKMASPISIINLREKCLRTYFHHFWIIPSGFSRSKGSVPSRIKTDENFGYNFEYKFIRFRLGL